MVIIYVITSMTENTERASKTYITGPAWRIAYKMVLVCGESGAISPAGAGEIGDAGVCASKEVAVAAAISGAKMFMPKVL
jgi:hypothetical protein